MKKQLESKMKNPTNALRNTDLVLQLMEAVVRRRSAKKVFLEISQNSQENTCARVFCLIKLQAEPCSFIKKETLAQGFPDNFAKFLRTPFLTERLWWLLLCASYSQIRDQGYDGKQSLSALMTHAEKEKLKKG